MSIIDWAKRKLEPIATDIVLKKEELENKAADIYKKAVDVKDDVVDKVVQGANIVKTGVDVLQGAKKIQESTIPKQSELNEAAGRGNVNAFQAGQAGIPLSTLPVSSDLTNTLEQGYQGFGSKANFIPGGALFTKSGSKQIGDSLSLLSDTIGKPIAYRAGQARGSVRDFFSFGDGNRRLENNIIEKDRAQQATQAEAIRKFRDEKEGLKDSGVNSTQNASKAQEHKANADRVLNETPQLKEINTQLRTLNEQYNLSQINDIDYVNRRKEIAETAKKQGLGAAQAEYENEMTKFFEYNSKAQADELIESVRLDATIKEKNIKDTIQTHLAERFITPDGKHISPETRLEEVADDMYKKQYTGLINDYYQEAQKAVAAGVVDSVDTFFSVNNVFEVAKNAAAIYRQEIMNNPNVVSDNGEIDNGVLFDIQKSDAMKEITNPANQSLRDFEYARATINKNDKRYTKIGKFIDQTFNSFDTLFSSDTKGSTFLGGQVLDSYQRQITETQTLWTSLTDVIANNPSETISYMVSIPVGFGAGGVGAGIARAGSRFASTRAALVGQRLGMSPRAIKALEYTIAKGAGAVGNTIESLPLDLLTNLSGSDWGVSAAANTFGGMFLGKVDNLAFLKENMRRAGTAEERFSIFNKATGLNLSKNDFEGIPLFQDPKTLDADFSVIIDKQKKFFETKAGHFLYSSIKSIDDKIKNMDATTENNIFKIIDSYDSEAKTPISWGVDFNGYRTNRADIITKIQNATDPVAKAKAETELLELTRGFTNGLLANVSGKSFKLLGNIEIAKAASRWNFKNFVDTFYTQLQAKAKAQGVETAMSKEDLYRIVVSSALSEATGNIKKSTLLQRAVSEFLRKGGEIDLANIMYKNSSLYKDFDNVIDNQTVAIAAPELIVEKIAKDMNAALRKSFNSSRTPRGGARLPIGEKLFQRKKATVAKDSGVTEEVLDSGAAKVADEVAVVDEIDTAEEVIAIAEETAKKIDADIVAEEIVKEAYNIKDILSDVLKKRVGNRAENAHDFVYEGIEKFINMLSTKNIVITKTQMDAVDGVVEVIADADGKTIFIGLAGHLIEQLDVLSKGGDVRQAQEAIAVLTHEIGHVVIESTIKNNTEVLDMMQGVLYESANFSKIKLFNPSLTDTRIAYYRELLDKGDTQLLYKEMYADKFSHDLTKAIVDPNGYADMMKNIYDKMPSDGETLSISSLQNWISAFIKPIAKFFSEVISGGKVVTPLSRYFDEGDKITLFNTAVMRGLLDVDTAAMKEGDKFFLVDMKTYGDDIQKRVDTILNTFADKAPDLDYQRTIYGIGNDGGDFQKIAYYMKRGGQVPDVNPALFANPDSEFIVLDLFKFKDMPADAQKRFLRIVDKARSIGEEDVKLATAGIASLRDEAGNILRTVGNGGLKLSNYLRSIPKSISSRGIIFEPGLSLIKHLIISNAESGYNFVRTMLNSYVDQGLRYTNIRAVEESRNMINQSLGLKADTPIGDAMVELYKVALNKLRALDPEGLVSESAKHDLLSPLLYSPLEYIGIAGNKTLAEKLTPVDAVLGVLVDTFKNTTDSNIPDGLRDLALSTKGLSVERWIGASIKNSMAADFGNHMLKMMDSDGIELVITKDELASFRYRVGGKFSTNADTVKQSTMNLIMSKLGNISVDIFNNVRKGLSDIGVDINNIATAKQESLEKMLSVLDDNIPGGPDIEVLQAVSSIVEFGVKQSRDKGYFTMVNALMQDVLGRASTYTKNIRKAEVTGDFSKVEELVDDSIKFNQKLETVRNSPEGYKNSIAGIVSDSIYKSDKGSGKFRLFGSGVSLPQDVVDFVAKELGVPPSKITGDVSDDVINEIINSYIKNGNPIYLTELILGDNAISAAFREAIEKSGLGVKYVVDKTTGSISDADSTKKVSGLLKVIMGFSIKANIAKNDPLLGRVLENMEEVRINAKVKLSNTSLGKEMGDDRYIDFYDYLTQARKIVFDKLNKGVFGGKNVRSTMLLGNKRANNVAAMKAVIENNTTGLTEEQKAIYSVIKGVLDDIEYVRKTYGLDSIYTKSGGIESFLTGQGKLDPSMGNADAIAASITGLWVFNRADEMGLVQDRYGSMKNFAEDLFFKGAMYAQTRGLGFRSVSTPAVIFSDIMRVLNKVGIFKTFGILNPTKAIQQMVSNVIGARGLEGVVVGRSINDIAGEISKYVDFNVAKAAGKIEEAEELVANPGSLRNIVGSVFGNFLQVGDIATQKKVLKASISNAVHDLYSYGGEGALDLLSKDIKRFEDFKKKYNITHFDIINEKRGNRKVMKYLSSLGLEGDEYRQAKQAALREWLEYKHFYNHTYNPFVNKVRNNMTTFFVTDNIPELSQSQILNNNRWAFGLLKWATGKSAESALNLYTVAKKELSGAVGWQAKLNGIRNILSSDEVSRLMLEYYNAFKLSDAINDMTQGQFGGNHDSELAGKMYMAALLGPAASAFMMLIGDMIYNGSRTAFRRRETDKKAGIDGSWYEYAADGIKRAGEEFVNRINLMPSSVITMFAQDVNTATMAAGGTGAANRRDAFGKSLLNSFFFDAVYRFSHHKAGQVYTRNDFDGSDSTNILEYVLNIASDPRLKMQEFTSDAYDMINPIRELGQEGKIQNETAFTRILKNIPLVGPLLAAGSYDNNVLMDLVEDYDASKKFYLLDDKTASSEALGDMYDQVHIMSLRSDEKVKEVLRKKGVAVKDATDEELIAASLAVSTYEPYAIALKGLTYQGDVGEAVKDLTYSTIDNETRANMAQMWLDFSKEYDPKQTAATNPAQKAKDFMVYAIEAGGVGTNVAQMQIIDFAKKEMAKQKAKEMGLKLSGQNEKLELLTIDDENGMLVFNDANSEAYKERAAYNRNLEKEIVIALHPILVGEFAFKKGIKDTMYKNDVNGPLGANSSTLANASSSIGAVKYLNEVVGMGTSLGGIEQAFNAYSFINQRVLSAVAGADISRSGGPEKVRDIINGYSSLVNEMLSHVSENQVPEAGINKLKIVLGASLGLFIKEIEDKIPGGTAGLVDVLGSDTLKQTANLLTTSAPITPETAFEVTTGRSTSKKGGSGGRRRSPKDIELGEKKRSKLLSGYNDLVEYSGKYPALSDIPLPKFQYIKDDRTGLYRPVEISVKPVLKDIESRQIRGDTPTPKGLSVARTPVKRGRVSSGRARTSRVIQGSKVYTRKTRG